MKDGALFHKGCFKCWICGTRLSLKTYHNNRNDTQDLEVRTDKYTNISSKVVVVNVAYMGRWRVRSIDQTALNRLATL